MISLNFSVIKSANVVCFSLSFAFVEFENTDDAKDALENLNNTDIEGRSIRLEFSQNSNRGDGGRGNSGGSSIQLNPCEAEK